MNKSFHMQRLLLGLFLLTVLLVSCKWIVRLSEEDLSWMPYEGNEVLIFKSSTGEVDTIFLIGKGMMESIVDPIFSLKDYEIIKIFSKHTDPFAKNSQHRYLQSAFFVIHKNLDKRTALQIQLAAKDAYFYRLSKI
jgi:hypothetical protein